MTDSPENVLHSARFSVRAYVNNKTQCAETAAAAAANSVHPAEKCGNGGCHVDGRPV